MSEASGATRPDDVARRQRGEGWYPVLMGERLACLYWTGQAWDVPRLARRAARLPKGSRIGGRIESPDDRDARES
jgi:hypothetical protein